jgi:hypothetical protein
MTTTDTPTTTRTVVYARAAGDRRTITADARDRAAFHEVAVAAPAVSGLVEVVSQTTVTRTRNDGTRLPGEAGEPVVTVTVLATLTVEAAQHLVGSLTGSVIDALDTRAASNGDPGTVTRTGYKW